MGCGGSQTAAAADTTPGLPNLLSRTRSHAGHAHTNVRGCQKKMKTMDEEAAEVLRRGDLRLVSGLWLIRQGKDFRIRRWQELPSEAFIPKDVAAKWMSRQGKHELCPQIVALTYRWLTPEHPDPDGIQLAQAVWFLERILQAMVFHTYYREDCEKSAKGNGGEVIFKTLRPGDIECVDVGLLWDFMSLPQHPRSESENQIFSSGLQAISQMYGSEENTLVLQLKGDPDGDHPYAKSGWCQVEEALSGILKPQSRVLAVGMEFEQYNRKAEDSNTYHRTRVAPPSVPAWAEEQGLAALWTEIEVHVGRPLGWFDSLVDSMSQNHKPPMHPDALAKLLNSAEVVFTNNSDLQMLVRKYKEFFEKAAMQVTAVEYPHDILNKRSLGASDGHRVDTIVAKASWPRGNYDTLAGSLAGTSALPGFACCAFVNLEGLNLTMEAVDCLMNAFSQMPALREVRLPVLKGTFEDLVLHDRRDFFPHIVAWEWSGTLMNHVLKANDGREIDVSSTLPSDMFPGWLIKSGRPEGEDFVPKEIYINNRLELLEQMGVADGKGDLQDYVFQTKLPPHRKIDLISAFPSDKFPVNVTVHIATVEHEGGITRYRNQFVDRAAIELLSRRLRDLNVKVSY